MPEELGEHSIQHAAQQKTDKSSVHPDVLQVLADMQLQLLGDRPRVPILKDLRDEAGKLIPIDVKAGDRVLFGKWSGTEVKIDGVEYLIMKESDIMGVLVESETRRKAA